MPAEPSSAQVQTHSAGVPMALSGPLAAAPAWAGVLAAASLGAVVLGVAALVCVLFAPDRPAPRDAAMALTQTNDLFWHLRTLAGLAGAAAWAFAAAAFPAWMIVRSRVRLAELHGMAQQAGRERAAAAATPDGQPPATLFSAAAADVGEAVRGEERVLARLAAWGQLGIGLPFCALGLLTVVMGWPRVGSADHLLSVGIALVLLAFPWLVLRGHLLAARDSDLPEAAGLARLCLLVLCAQAGAGLLGIAISHQVDVAIAGASVVVWAWRVLASLCALVLAELAVRLAAAPALPPRPALGPTGLGDSALAGLLLARLNPLASTGASLRERFGVDLSQSWAVGFLRRAALPLLGVLLLIVWCLSAFSALRPGERGVLLRLGRPVSLCDSGVTVHLPWPFDRVERVDAAAVREVRIGGTGEAPNAAAMNNHSVVANDRRWRSLHDERGVFLAAAAPLPGITEPPQPGAVEMLAVDLTVQYRPQHGLDGLVAWMGSTTDPAARITVLARRMLQSWLAAHPAGGLGLGGGAAIEADLHQAMQAELDAQGTGIAIVAVHCESLHPTAAMAEPYEQLWAAAIAAATTQSNAQMDAERIRSTTHSEVTRLADQARGQAAGILATARAKVADFAAQSAFANAAPEAFRLERWLGAIQAALAKRRVSVIDHRLSVQGGGMMYDLRPFTAPDARTRSTGSNP